MRDTGRSPHGAGPGATELDFELKMNSKVVVIDSTCKSILAKFVVLVQKGIARMLEKNLC